MTHAPALLVVVGQQQQEGLLMQGCEGAEPHQVVLTGGNTSGWGSAGLGGTCVCRVCVVSWWAAVRAVWVVVPVMVGAPHAHRLLATCDRLCVRGRAGWGGGSAYRAEDCPY